MNSRNIPAPRGKNHLAVPTEEPAVAIPFCIRSERGLLTFFTTTTMFGSPVDITLSELAVKCFYPADAATAQIIRETPAAQNGSPSGKPSTIQSIAS